MNWIKEAARQIAREWDSMSEKAGREAQAAQDDSVFDAALEDQIAAIVEDAHFCRPAAENNYDANDGTEGGG